MVTGHKWTAADIPHQAGKVMVITGGNGGLGYETVRVLAWKGTHVILACRDPRKGIAARDQIYPQIPDASIEVMELDLASLASIRQFAADFEQNHDQLHVLVNNAGVMATPRSTTADGFELQFGTNHLGHFALTGLLLDVLLKTPNSRIVTVSSTGELTGRINLDDLMSERFYERWLSYGQSKLANVMFAYELQRRLAAAGSATISLAVHPGYVATDLRKRLMTRETPFLHRMTGYFFEWISQSVEMGALPQLYAATAPDVQGGEYYGPDGFLQRTGYPRRLRSSRRSHDERVASQLWAASEDLTGVRYGAFTHRSAPHQAPG